MRDRTIVCPCEDVELHEIEEAIERGYASLETLKRSTAVTTGPCQGKWCLHATIEVLAEETDRDPEELGGITHRQPVRGVPLAALAQAEEPAEADEPGEPGDPDDPSGPGGSGQPDDADDGWASAPDHDEDDGDRGEGEDRP